MTQPHPRCYAALAMLLLSACARMGPPPGGPSDRTAPKLIGTVPESTGTYPAWKSEVEFRFDEVVSEGGSPNLGTGTGDLEKLVILSPTQQIPVVKWKRDRITVRPREGWKPNRVYRIELLPGVLDLRRNRSDTSVVLTFGTGGQAPTDTVRGTVIDWAAGKPGRQALIELYLLPDSLVYRAETDSAGRFAIGPLPRAGWTVYAAIDQNRDHRRESREAWDSTVVAAGTSDVITLWTIPRDTVGPRITTITPDDSLKATITFSLPLDPHQAVESLQVSFLRQEDSMPVPYLSLLPKLLDDSLERARRTSRDTTAVDSLAQPARPPQPGKGRPAPAPFDTVLSRAAKARVDSILRTRPALYNQLVLRVGEPFMPEKKYLFGIRGLRSVAGASSDAKGVLAIPKPRPAPKPASDSTGAGAPDSTRQAGDTATAAPRAKP